MTELEQLIAEQQKDNATDKVSRPCNEVTICQHHLENISKKWFQGKDFESTITWGEPAKIVQARFDKQCPNCGARPEDVEYSNSVLINGFEYHNTYGLCACGFAFDIRGLNND